MENYNIKLLNTCHLLVKIISIFTIVASIAIIFGNYHHITILTSISTGWVNMKTNAAICFLLSGLGLLILNNQNRSQLNNVLLVIISISILLISGITLIEYLFGVNFGIDELLIKESLPLPPGTIFAGRMTFITASNFLLISITYLMLFKKSLSAWLIHTIAWIVLLMVFISISNYMYAVDMHYFVTRSTTMAMNTNILFLFLGISILLLKPTEGMVEILLKKSTGGYLLRSLIPVLLVTPMSINFIEDYFAGKGFYDAHFGDTINSAGTLAIVGFFILFIAKFIDRKEKDIKIAEMKIKHNEMIFHQLAENIDVVFFTSSPDFNKTLYISPAYEKIWGRSLESQYKNAQAWHEAVLPEDLPTVDKALLAGLEKEGGGSSSEFRIKRPDGSIRHIFAKIRPLIDEKNEVFCVIGIALDMTDIKIKKIYAQLQYDTLRLIESEKNIKEFTPKILELICNSLDFDYANLWLIDESTNDLRCVNIWHKGKPTLHDFEIKNRQKTFKIGEGFLGRIWQTKNMLWLSDYSNNPAFARSKDAKIAGLNSAFGVPIIYHDKIFGILEFFNTHITSPESPLLVLMENVSKSIGEFIERTHTNEQRQDISRHDALTGLLNRSIFEEDLNQFIVEKKSTLVTMIVLDIDRFKLVNEAFGHGYGDLLLKILATKFANISNKEMSLSRLSGDKFIFCLPEMNRKDAYDFAQIILHQLREPLTIKENTLSLSASIGIALYPKDGLDSKTLIINADLAVKKAKLEGGNRIQFFTDQLAIIASEMITLETELRKAILDNQFVLVYQPQVDLKTGAICSAEVLVRWEHPLHGLMSPNTFITFAEKNNLIIPLNEQIIRMVFQQISASDIDVPISINISAQQFKDSFHLVDYLEALMNEFSVNAKSIELEITENMLMEETEHNIAILTALNKLGFKIAIDDFGTGFSSFTYVKRLPFYKMKIDKSFITGLAHDLGNEKIVRAIIMMGHSLDKIVVAEGAETKAEVDFLKQEKCDIIQGFYYYKPMSFDAFTTLIKRE